VCAEGLSFNARIDKGNALLTLEGKTLTLAPVAGAFGSQYAGEDVLFIARVNEAMLTRGNGPLMTCMAK
jgi:membrane-bound inhibitor of C-type lysozyme